MRARGAGVRVIGFMWLDSCRANPGRIGLILALKSPPQPRRQVVRHLTLTQAFGGSNPSGAASFRASHPNITSRHLGQLNLAQARARRELDCRDIALALDAAKDRAGQPDHQPA